MNPKGHHCVTNLAFAKLTVMPFRNYNYKNCKTKGEKLLDWLRFNITIFEFVLANEEPRGAWKMLVGEDICALRAPREGRSPELSFAEYAHSDFWRSLLYKIRTYFESNPDEEI